MIGPYWTFVYSAADGSSGLFHDRRRGHKVRLAPHKPLVPNAGRYLISHPSRSAGPRRSNVARRRRLGNGGSHSAFRRSQDPSRRKDAGEACSLARAFVAELAQRHLGPAKPGRSAAQARCGRGRLAAEQSVGGFSGEFRGCRLLVVASSVGDRAVQYCEETPNRNSDHATMQHAIGSSATAFPESIADDSSVLVLISDPYRRQRPPHSSRKARANWSVNGLPKYAAAVCSCVSM
jgi:hypothetical protein